jgi:GTP cyclohydrolase I
MRFGISKRQSVICMFITCVIAFRDLFGRCHKFFPGGCSVMAPRPESSEVEAAVRTLLRWAGDDPDREGLIDTPKRVARAYQEFFAGYGQDPHAILAATFEESGDYDDLVLVRHIRFESHCEHHF